MVSSTPLDYAAVALGSGLGAASRFGISLIFLHSVPGAVPWATLAVNVVGSFAIGFFQTITGPEGRVLARPATRQFAMAGFCGGLTTFSVFSLETVVLVSDGAIRLAALNVIASFLLWVPAAAVGHLVARNLNRLR